MLRRTARLTAEFAGGLLLVLLIFAAAGYWFLSRGPVTIGFLSGPIESVVNSSLSGMSVRIKDVVLEQNDDGSGVRFRLRDMSLLDNTGGIIARAPRAAIGVDWSALVRGRVTPTYLALIGPRLLLKRKRDGSFQLGHGTGTEIGSPAVPSRGGGDADNVLGVIFDALSGTKGSGGLADISIREAKLELYDEPNNVTWRAPRADLVFRRVDKGVSLLTTANVASGDKHWGLELSAFYADNTDRIDVSVRVKGLVPAEIARKVPILSTFAQVRFPLSGQAKLALDRKGKVLQANATLSAGAGVVDFPGFITEPIVIDGGELNVAFDPKTGSVTLDRSLLLVKGTNTSLFGLFTPVRNAVGDLQTIGIKLQAKAAARSSGVAGSRKGAIDTIVLEGVADLPDRRLDVASLFVAAGEARVLLTGYLRDEEKAPAIRLDGKLSRIPSDLLIALWPPSAAPGAREWLSENVIKGTITKGEVKIDITSDALARALEGAPLPSEQLRLKFDMVDVDTRYLGDLPPIRGANGSGLVEGDRFEMRLERGKIAPRNVKPLVISNGLFLIKSFSGTGPMSQLTFQITGPIASVLTALDYEPLGYMTKFGLDIKRVGGDSRTKFKLAIPLLKDLKLEEVTLKAKAKLSTVRIDDVLGDKAIEDGDLILDVTKRGLVGVGKIRINGVPANFKWREDFEGKSKYSSRFDLTAKLDAGQRKRLDIDISQFIEGPVGVNLIAYGKGPDVKLADVTADLTGARLKFDAIGWSRPPGRKAVAKFSIGFDKKNLNEFSRFRATGQGIDVAGAFSLDGDGNAQSVAMTKLNLGANRMQLRGKRRKDGIMTLKLKADVLDIRPMVSDIFKNTGSVPTGRDGRGGKPELIDLSAVVVQALAHNNVRLKNVSTSMRLRDGDIEALSLTGKFARRGAIEVAITKDAKGGRKLSTKSSNAGEVLRALDVYSKVRGGSLSLSARLGSRGSAAGEGLLKIKKFRVAGEGAIGRVSKTVSANNKDSGERKPRTANDGSTYFASLRVPYTTFGEIVQVRNAVLKGPSIGASAQGTMNTATGRIDFGGTFIPAYTLNTFISNVPIVGLVLTGGKDQALFGVNFAVGGSISRPKFTINPVSAIAPGILRNLFVTGGGRLRSTGSTPKADVVENPR